ncbi:MAG TPA: mechanosensitive ion channel domain-containing protein [Verrucomicrobiae bacterium]|nr:mechanosensitive ion channel domain-containing protein [Verrucomicrobiae bacterium]
MADIVTNSVPAATNANATVHTPWRDKLIDYVIAHGGALLSAIIVIIVGFIAARWLGRLTDRWAERKAMEPPVRMLLVRIVKFLVLVGALVVALGTAGLDVTAMIAGLSVAGVGVGLAAQGVLGNLFAGLTIIFTKPFRVNEYIELLSVQGQVAQIELLSTTLIHADRSRVVIPNRKIVGEILHNYGTIRQLELNVGVAYGTNLSDALLLIDQILKSNARVLKEFNPVVGVSTLGNSSINIAVKPWVNVADFGMAGPEIYQAILNQFRERRIEIPFPQHEVRLLNSTPA